MKNGGALNDAASLADGCVTSSRRDRNRVVDLKP